MANDGGIMALIEVKVAEALAALQHSGAAVFKTAEVWNYQIYSDKGGVDKFVSYAPFAFVAFQPPDSAREGGYDLREKLVFAVAIGTASKKRGVARIGDATHLGISMIYDLTIKSLDGFAPDGIECDPLYFAGSELTVETPRAYAMELYFAVNLIRNNA